MVAVRQGSVTVVWSRCACSAGRGNTRRTRLARRARRRHLPLSIAAALTLALLTPSSASAQTRVLGPGGWSYFGDPRAVHAGGKTFIGYTDLDGYSRVAEIEKGRVIRQRRFGPRSRVDDHTNPSIDLQPDGRLSFFYNNHQGPRMYIRSTRYPYSLRSISSASALPTNTSGRHGYSYPNPLRASSRLWLFWRGGNFQPNYSVRVPGRWTRAETLALGPCCYRLSDGRLQRHRPYAKYDTDGQNIHVTMTEGNEAAYRNSVYYAEVRPGDGLYTATGRRISRLGDPPAVRDLDRVRGAAAGQWALDIATQDGRPIVVYRRRGSDGGREYWYARHNGERWLNYKLTSAYSRYEGQIASLTLDHETPNTVYLTANGSNGRHEVEVWATPDGGETWSRRALTRDSTVDNYRPVTPRRLTAWEEAVWFSGRRTYYREFDTEVIYRLLEAARELAKRVDPDKGDPSEVR